MLCNIEEPGNLLHLTDKGILQSLLYAALMCHYSHALLVEGYTKCSVGTHNQGKITAQFYGHFNLTLMWLCVCVVYVCASVCLTHCIYINEFSDNLYGTLKCNHIYPL